MTYDKSVPVDLSMKSISTFNNSFTSRSYLHCAILKALYSFKEKSAHKVREMQFFLQNVQNVIFKILKMFRNKVKNTTLMILLFCHYFWSLLCWNYWRYLMLWDSTSWSRLKLLVEIQSLLHPCDTFLINNRNMTGSSVEKKYFLV